MTKKGKLLDIIMVTVEIFAICIFIILLKNKKLQMWLSIFILGVISSLFIGRFYCGWICQMHTIFKPINYFFNKFKIKRFKAPKFLQNSFVRILFVFLFIIGMLLTRILNLKFNILVIITLFSVLVVLLFEENFWHKNICPFGTILSLSSKKSILAITIDEDRCISCGKCQKVCPSSSIVTLNNNKRRNIKTECLVCGKCINVCPVSVISLTN